MAKEALGIEYSSNIGTEEKQVAKKGVFIDRDKIVELIREAGNKQWTDFTANELTTVGNVQRCVMTAERQGSNVKFVF